MKNQSVEKDMDSEVYMDEEDFMAAKVVAPKQRKGTMKVYIANSLQQGCQINNAGAHYIAPHPMTVLELGRDGIVRWPLKSSKGDSAVTLIDLLGFLSDEDIKGMRCEIKRVGDYGVGVDPMSEALCLVIGEKFCPSR